MNVGEKEKTECEGLIIGFLIVAGISKQVLEGIRFRSNV